MRPLEQLARPGATLGEGLAVVRVIAEGKRWGEVEVTRGGEPLWARVLLDGGVVEVERARQRLAPLTSLRAPHVLPVLDVMVDERLGALCLLHPLRSGRTLAGRLREGPLHPTVAARLFVHIATGLVAVQAEGAHGSLSSEAVYLDMRDGVVAALLTDVGVAGALAAEGAEPPAARGDLVALGHMLYAALSGYDVSADKALSWLQDVAPWVDAPLASLTHAMLIDDDASGCRSALDFIDALTPFLGGTTHVTEAMLAPLDDSLRAEVSPRGEPPRSFAERARPASQLTARDPRIGQRVGRRYVLTRLLGQGGMGSVYEAEGPDGRYAVKVISSEDAHDQGALRRFVREARAAMSLDSDHVVRVIDADTDPRQGAPFIAMELLEGEDLQALLRRERPLDPAVVARLFADACLGVETAHRAGLVHRDIKPANLFLHERAGEIVVKVCDFGVVKRTTGPDAGLSTSELTRSGGVVGSPLYMSPEQARSSKRVDARSDVWSLCMAMHEALSGERPFSDVTSAGDLILAICTTDVAPLQRVAPWVPAGLAAVVHRGLRRASAERFSSAAELRAALSPHALEGPLRRQHLQALSADRRRVAEGPSRRARVAGVAAVAVVATALVSATRGDRPTNPPPSPSAPAASSSISPLERVEAPPASAPAPSSSALRQADPAAPRPAPARPALAPSSPPRPDPRPAPSRPKVERDFDR